MTPPQTFPTTDPTTTTTTTHPSPARTTPILSMGLNTYRVPLTLFSANRQKLSSSLFTHTTTTTIPPNSIVFLEGGPSTTRFDSDHEPIFRQESYFHYLFGVKEPDVAGCVILKEQNEDPISVLFVPKLPEDYATFMGRIKSLEEIREEYHVDTVCYRDEMESFLEQKLRDGSGKLLLLHGPNSDSGKFYTPPTFVSSFLQSQSDTTTLFPILSECRVTKSPQELSLLRHVTEVTSLGHVYVMRNAKPNTMMEYQFESLFKHYCYYHFGHRHVGYTPICGCGPNGAVLHYGHAGAPNDGVVRDGMMCLLDMGSEYFGYGSDVTCTFPANGRFTDRQRVVYEGVLKAQKDVMEMMKPGVSWVDCHLTAEMAILTALKELGIIKYGGTIETLVEKRLGAMFMPHGLGHFIGIDTHDVGGYLPKQPERSKLDGLKSLRTARVLKEGMTLTVEPGCYFIAHLMNKVIEGEFREFVDVDVLEQFRGFGGVRLEDVVLVTEDGCENFTRCPRTVNEVESVMNGGKWPPVKDEAKELKRTRLTAAD